ncbi:cytochrome c-type biogenesis protein CcmH [Psychrobium sp. nBUS_13]|uniref:cytochrome c-type biogenesis protein n=1 Tax=Psychrobium sp. nBUS_13 TaxID=3395319 RepID=UPI003EB75C2D
MKQLIIALMTFIIVLFSTESNSTSVETYTFSTSEYEVRFHKLNKILRCPKCQNQNLADSNSLISQDLRREVRRLLEEGRTDEQIMEYMVMRYGSFVLYKPKLDRVTYFLWYGPIGFGVFGVIMVAYIVMRQRKRRGELQVANSQQENDIDSLTEQEQAQIDKLLK